MTDLLPEEIQTMRDSVGRFMRTEVLPVMDAYEERGELPRELVRKAGAAGFYGCLFPESVGGTGMGYLAQSVLVEEIARHDIRFVHPINQQSGTCPTSVFLAGTPEQVRKYVPRFIAGEIIGMMALTEPGGGSDALGSMRMTARRDGDVYRLNGSKTWITMGTSSDAGLVLAKTDPAAGAQGVTAFIVETNSPGFSAKRIPTMGLSKAFGAAALFFDDVAVPVENRLGAEGEGFKIVMRALQSGRINVGSMALGIARGCYEDALQYAKDRMVRGQPLGRYQMIQSDIAEMAVALEASRAIMHEAARHMDAGLPTNRLASIAKFHCSQTAKLCADKAQQIFGGYGLSTEFRVARYKCYADLMFVGEGPANVQKILIAEDALGYKEADRHHGKTGLRQMGDEQLSERAGG